MHLTRAVLLILLICQTHFARAAEPDQSGPLVMGFENEIENSKGEKVSWVIESFHSQNEQQYKASHNYVQNLAREALKENPSLNVELVVANYTDDAAVSVQALNQRAAEKLPEAVESLKDEVRLTNIKVETAVKEYKEFSELANQDRFYATEINVPEVPGLEQEATTSSKNSRRTKILTIVRAISSLGVNTFMIYITIGSDMFTPLAIPALLFYPVSETLLQKFAPQYEKLLRRANFVFARTAIQTTVSLACITVHVALLSSIGVTTFAWLPVAMTSFKDAIVTQAWWEMVVKGKPKWLTGEYVSFGLGVIGMTGLLLEASGMKLGSYILYGLGLSGAVFWIKNGAFSTLKSDAIRAKNYFVEKYKDMRLNLKSSCRRLRNNFHSHSSLRP